MRKPFNEDFRVSQDFGNDLVINGVHVYAQYGYKGHNGIDYAAPSGTTVIAPHAGKVIEAANDVNGYGKYLKIENEKEGSVLGHNGTLLVSVGDIVTEGQPVAISDNTGNSTGAHIHWGYYTIPRNRQNGYGGFINQASLISENTNMPTELYKGLDLNNKDSMKVAVDVWYEVVKENKYIKKEDSEAIFNQLKNEYEGKLTNANNTSQGLADNLMGVAIALGLPKEAHPDEILAKAKELKEQANDPIPGTSSPSTQVPETVAIGDEVWSVKELVLTKIIK
jgi:murein DD-endopeptidase MepM/ murein hydrolase activator NlpD